MDRIGRKWTLIATGGLDLIAYLIMIFTKSLYLYYIARLLCGISGGGVFSAIPVYIGEISHVTRRGMLSSLMNIFLCTGELFSYCVGPYVSVRTFSIILAIFPAIFVFMFSIFAPETPLYYFKTGKGDLARKSLQKLRGSKSEIGEEFSIIRKSVEESEHGTLRDILGNTELKRGLVISLGLMFFQQLSGIMAIMFYAQKIFVEAGVHLDSAICAIIIGAIQLFIGTIIPFIIDRLGRKKLLFISAIGTFFSEGILGGFCVIRNYTELSSLSIVPFICMIAYIITYNIGCGPIPWVIMGELFPNNVKSAASLLSTSCSCLLAFLVANFFQTVVETLGIGGTFLIFTVSCFLSIPFCYFLVIETKGKTFLQIREELRK